MAAKEGTRTCGLEELHHIFTTLVACAHAEDSIRKYEENRCLAVVNCYDATVFHNASATRVLCLWTYGRIAGHTMMVRHGPHGGFLMGEMIWPICKGWMP